MGILWYSKRHRLAKEFEKWCKENNTDSKNITNVITWLVMNNLIWYIEITYKSGTVVKSVPNTYDKVKEMSEDMNKILDFSKITFKTIKKYENPEPCIFEPNGQGRLF